MKLFKCQGCGQLLCFENTRCERCHRALGYLPEQSTLSALDPLGTAPPAYGTAGPWTALADGGTSRIFCDNAMYEACNWMQTPGGGTRCAACRHNRVIPDLGVPENLVRWRKLEDAKHRLFYTLMRLGLPLADRIEDPEHGLVFDFLADNPDPDGPKVMTGHDNGVITMAIVEADDAERERRRTSMHEPYRTLLGHFRHEVGHHFWDLLVRDGGFLAEFRAIFGDDRQDYGQALQHHYDEGPPADWRDHYISAYATTHPWEDWAETWAHYLHIVDTLETGQAFGLHIHPTLARDDELTTDLDFDPHVAGTVQQLIDAWLPLAFAVNNLNRSMGHQDLYPFVLSPGVITKLGFVHKVIHADRSSRPAVADPDSAQAVPPAGAETLPTMGADAA